MDLADLCLTWVKSVGLIVQSIDYVMWRLDLRGIWVWRHSDRIAKKEEEIHLDWSMVNRWMSNFFGTILG